MHESNNPITVSQPDFGADEAAAVEAVLASHWVSMGPKTAEFEAALAERLKVRYVIATSSCTAALHLALDALERDHRDEIIVPSLTFAATIQAIIMAGYVPVFAEVDRDTLTLDCDDVSRFIGSRTRAIVPVHLAGQPCDCQQLSDIALDARIDVVSDSAHAFGSTFRGKTIAHHETASCYSFSANKNISCGEGGAVATNSDPIAARITQARFLGINNATWNRRTTERPWEYSVDTSGFRYHMSDINAAIGLAQLKRLDEFAHKRRALAAAYDAELNGLPGVLPVGRNLEDTIPHLYIMRATHGLRDALYTHLRERGILCGVHYTPNHRQPAFAKFTRSMPVTEQSAEEIISLPLHTRLEPEQFKLVVSSIRDFLIRAHASARRRNSRALVEAAK